MIKIKKYIIMSNSEFNSYFGNLRDKNIDNKNREIRRLNTEILYLKDKVLSLQENLSKTKIKEQPKEVNNFLNELFKND